MRLGLALILAVTFPTVPDPENATQAPALIKKFEAAYRSSKTLRANFLERYFDNGREVRSEAGTAYFAKPGKMRWEYASPEANLYLVDGKWSWFYVPGDHTVTRIRAKESSDSRTPLALLAGEMKVSRVCRSVNLDRSSKPTRPQGVVLRCNLQVNDEAVPTGLGTPSSPASSRDSYALFELNPENGELFRVLVVDPGGVQVEFQFSNWEFDPHLEASKFKFLPSKGVAIVDGDLGSSESHGRKP